MKIHKYSATFGFCILSPFAGPFGVVESSGWYILSKLLMTKVSRWLWNPGTPKTETSLNPTWVHLKSEGTLRTHLSMASKWSTPSVLFLILIVSDQSCFWRPWCTLGFFFPERPVSAPPHRAKTIMKIYIAPLFGAYALKGWNLDEWGGWKWFPLDMCVG